MCGRFYFDELKERKFKVWYEQFSLPLFSTAEVFPGTDILILTKQKNQLIPKVLHWGKKIYDKEIINVRSETYKSKPSYARMQRCIIPVTAFYEWKSKEKYYIHKDEMMYLAGLYDDSSVVIMTGESEEDMRNIHHRTPIIFTKSEMIQYLNGYLEPKVNDHDLQFQLENNAEV